MSPRPRRRHDLSANEQFAHDVIERHQGVALVGHDDGSEDMMVDLIFARPGQYPHLGVEETSPTSPRRAAFLGAARQHGSKDIPTLRSEWLMRFAALVNIKKELPGLVRLLEGLEAAGVDKVRSDATDDGWALERRLANHGVRYALRVREIGPPGRIRLEVSRGGVGAGDDPDAIVRFAERVAKPDPGNLQKLRASGLDELHLFVRALGKRPVGVALDNRRTPDRDPHLPAPLTGISIAADTERSPIAFWHRGHDWSLVDPPDDPMSRDECSDGRKRNLGSNTARSRAT